MEEDLARADIPVQQATRVQTRETLGQGHGQLQQGTQVEPARGRLCSRLVGEVLGDQRQSGAVAHQGEVANHSP
jgi:hypothetical protein